MGLNSSPFLFPCDKYHGQAGDGDRGNGASCRGLAVYGNEGSGANARQSYDKSEDLPDQMFDENECVDALLFRASVVGFQFRLLENPIDNIGSERVKAFQSRNREDGTVGVVLLEGQLAFIVPDFGCSLPIGPSVLSSKHIACHCQQLWRRVATLPCPARMHCGMDERNLVLDRAPVPDQIRKGSP